MPRSIADETCVHHHPPHPIPLPNGRGDGARAGMSEAAGITLDGVRAGYGETVVLEGVSLTLPARGTLAVLGRNGVGKTTLLSTIMGHTTLHGGSIRLRGREMSGLAPHRRARAGIGWVPQEREIFRSLTVDENLAVAARERNSPSSPTSYVMAGLGPAIHVFGRAKKVVDGRNKSGHDENKRHSARWNAERVYDLFPSLAVRRRNYGNQLSGGEQQMLAIGRALMGNPAVLLMDEPLEGLAPVIVDVVLKGIERLKREDALAIVLVEQHARQALAATERVIVLERGKIVHEGESNALLAAPERMAQLMGIERRQGGRIA
jgi:branched-chain amino acid transport system ATP-binding protein